MHRDRQAAMSVGGAVSYPGDVAAGLSGGSGSPGVAAGARVSYQAHRDVQISGDFMFAVTSLSVCSSTSSGIQARVSVRYNPTVDWFAFVVGARGAGIFPCLTGRSGGFGGDIGVRIGHRIAGWLEPVLSQSLGLSAWSLPGVPGEFGPDASATTELGLIVYPTPSVGISAFLSMFYGFGDPVSGSFRRPAFVPSVGVRYVFDASSRRRAP